MGQATYNWSYKPNITNKYGILINASADDIKPSNACYVALFGNDTTGNGSRQKPFKTIAKAFSVIPASTILILGAGVYRESYILIMPSSPTIVGDGDVSIDISYLGALTSSNISGLILYNFKLIGDGISTFTTLGNTFNLNARDIIFDGSWVMPAGNNDTFIRNCIIQNFNGPLTFTNSNFGAVDVISNTIVNCNNVQLLRSAVRLDSCVFVSCNISVSDHLSYFKARYTIFYRCNFKVTDGLLAGGVLYPSVPVGYTYYSDITDLKNAYLTLFSTKSLNGCLIEDPKFNNPEIGDFSLAFDSPAKNLSYLGTFVGAQSIAYPIKAKATEADGDFDFSTNVNLTIADNSITLTDTSLDASIESKVKTNLIGRELSKAPIYGFSADRNGQYIDSIADLALTTTSAGTNLLANTPYIVEVGAITYNGSVIQAGQRFTTTAVLSFSTVSGGICREILEAPQRHTILAKFGNGGATKVVSDPLTIGYWYYVNGTITYEGVAYTDEVFKATTTNSFTGSGTVIEAMTTEVYQHYEPGIKFTSNNVGDVRTGVIIRGNGDPGYERGAGKEFPINAKFIQLKYVIGVNNLKP